VGLRRANRRYSSFGDFAAFWADWLEHERWRAVQGIIPEHRGHALVRPHADGDIEYVIAVEVRPGTQAPSGYRAIRIPPTLYAIFEAIGEPVRTIQSLALGIYSRLSRDAQSRRRLGGWDLERYDLDRAAPPGHLRCGLWIPVVRPLPGG
jgi:predicted transcriptional regulator YdeE